MKKPYIRVFSYTRFVLRTNLLCAKKQHKNKDVNMKSNFKREEE